MANAKKEVKIGGITIYHQFFDYLPVLERAELHDEITDGKCIIISVVIDGHTKYGVVLEATGDFLHVREMGGSFTKNLSTLECFMTALAKFWHKKYLSFCTSKKGVEIIGKKMGFKMNKHGDFVKAVA